jgi:hypothetical protein
MASFKKLSTSDVFVVPYTANKNWDLTFACVPQDGAYFTIFKGKNLINNIDLVNGPITEAQYESLVYRQINHLYYQYHSSSILDSHSLLDSMYYESYMTESSTISTGSYFDFNENPEFINNFPTQSNDIIRVMSFNQNIYGEQIKPNNFILTASGSYQLADDGLGNVYDISFTGYYVQPGYYAPPGYIAELQNKVHVGNIFYSQGVVVITNQNYKCFLPTPPNAINDYFRVLNVQRVKKLDILANDYIDSCNSTAIVTSSIVTYPYTGYNFPDVTLITGSLFVDQCEILGVTPGNYKLYYTVNDNTCLTSNTASINLELYKLPLEMSRTHQPIVCVGGVSPVTFSINYGVPPYQYSIGGVTYNNLANCEWYQPTASTTAPIGNSILYIKDSEGTIVSSSFAVAADIFTVTTNKIDITCGGTNNGKIAVTGSSTYGAPYSASINGGSNWQGFTANTLFSNLSPATYTVTVKDNICSTSSLVTIIQTPSPTVTVNSTTADCPEPGQDVGSISITVTGGTAPYTYSWVTGSTVVRTVEDPTGLPAGSYTVTVTDANSCTATGSATISSVSSISINLTATNSSCGVGNGQISASVSGGSGNGFSYLWNTGTTGSIVTGSTGTYTLTVTDTGTGCTSSGSATITSTPAVSSVSASVTYNQCDSSLVVTATGGTSPYTFVAVNGGTTRSVGPTTSPGTIVLNSGLAGGTWNITVADANGCTATTTRAVRAREYRYSDPVCQELNGLLIVDESSGVGTNLKTKANSQDTSNLFTTSAEFVQIHSGTIHTFEAPIYPGDAGWVGNYASASHTMSVYTTGSLTFTTSSIETGSAHWPFYSLTGNSSRYYLVKAESNLVTGSTPPPPPPVSYNCISGSCIDPGNGTGTYATLVECQSNCAAPSASACYTTSTGTIPVTGGSGTTAQGTITVTGGSVNVWARYNSGGTTSGTATFYMNIDGFGASGTFTIVNSGQTGYSSSGGTASGYITLSPGTYNFSLTKSDNLTSGNEVRFSWASSTVTNPTSSTSMSACTTYYTLLGPTSGLSGTSGGACANYTTTRSYSSNVNFIQSNVTYIYDSTSPTLTPLDTGGQWKPLSFNGTNLYAVITNSSGMVTNYTSC